MKRAKLIMLLEPVCRKQLYFRIRFTKRPLLLLTAGADMLLLFRVHKWSSRGQHLHLSTLPQHRSALPRVVQVLPVEQLRVVVGSEGVEGQRRENIHSKRMCRFYILFHGPIANTVHHYSTIIRSYVTCFRHLGFPSPMASPVRKACMERDGSLCALASPV